MNGNHGNGDVWVVKINSPPSTPHKLSGPKSGYIRKAYIYSTSATDPDGDKIKYTFDWGDGTNSVSGFVDSGERVASSHRWIEPGKYCIKGTCLAPSACSLDAGLLDESMTINKFAQI